MEEQTDRQDGNCLHQISKNMNLVFLDTELGRSINLTVQTLIQVFWEGIGTKMSSRLPIRNQTTL